MRYSTFVSAIFAGMVTILVGIIGIVCLFMASAYLLPYASALFGKNFIVSGISAEVPKRFGQLGFKNGHILIRTISLKTLSLDDIEKIEGYVETTQGLEEYCCVDIIFNDDRKICLDGSQADQQAVINQILVMLQAKQIDWSEEIGPFTFEKQLVYGNYR